MSNLEEPDIVGWGRQHRLCFDASEYVDSLRRAFVENRADFVVLDSCMTGQRFLAAGIAWALDNGILRHAETGGDEQSQWHKFRLTPNGADKLGRCREVGT